MDWFGWRLPKDPAADKSAAFGPKAILQELDQRVPQYLDDVDQGRLIYPACKRTPSDAHGDIRSIWDHTRLEAVRYVTMVPRREFEPLAEPARQPDVLAGADRDKFSGTLSNFRKLTGLAQQWWTMDGAAERCGQMLAERDNPPLMLFLIWTEYTRLAKEVAAAALFGSSIERATERRREMLRSKFAGRPDELNAALDELAETMASFERARDPDDLMG
jgi:hypothetical protein